MKRNLWIVASITVLMLACSLPMFPSTSDSGETPEQSQPFLPFAEESTPTLPPIPSEPIGLRQGLASLNSYRLIIRTINNGPTEQDINETTFLIESASDGENWHMRNEAKLSTAEEPELETSQIDQYKVGNVLCAISAEDSEAEQSDIDPQAEEIMDAWYGLMDLVPLVSDPVFVATESLNGVQVNHFTFNVSGLGVSSGAEVVSSSGEYWLAVDGQYIVKYQVILETRSGPAVDANTKTMRSEFHIELKDINQPITISLPATCP